MRNLLAAAVLVTTALSTAACDMNPCDELQSTAQEREIAATGVELEREVSGTECVLNPDGTWSMD